MDEFDEEILTETIKKDSKIDFDLVTGMLAFSPHQNVLEELMDKLYCSLISTEKIECKRKDLLFGILCFHIIFSSQQNLMITMLRALECLERLCVHCSTEIRNYERRFCLAGVISVVLNAESPLRESMESLYSVSELAEGKWQERQKKTFNQQRLERISWEKLLPYLISSRKVKDIKNEEDDLLIKERKMIVYPFIIHYLSIYS